jgi:hypothetical protein
MDLLTIAGVIVIAWGAIAAFVVMLVAAAGRADRAEERLDGAFAASVPAPLPARVRRQRAVSAARAEQAERQVRTGMRTAIH